VLYALYHRSLSFTANSSINTDLVIKHFNFNINITQLFKKIMKLSKAIAESNPQLDNHIVYLRYTTEVSVSQ